MKKKEVVIPDISGIKISVKNINYSAKLVGMLRPMGTKGYVIAKDIPYCSGRPTHWGDRPLHAVSWSSRSGVLAAGREGIC